MKRIHQHFIQTIMICFIFFNMHATQSGVQSHTLPATNTRSSKNDVTIRNIILVSAAAATALSTIFIWWYHYRCVPRKKQAEELRTEAERKTTIDAKAEREEKASAELSKEQECSAAALLQKSTIGVAQDLGGMPSQEDRAVVIVTPEYGFFGVCDGHNGPNTAKYLKEHLAEHLNKHVTSDILATGPQSIKKALSAAIINIDQLLLSKILLNKSGSTLVGAFIHQNTAYIINVGNCQALLGNTQGEPWESRPHALSNVTEQRRIKGVETKTGKSYATVTKQPIGYPPVQFTRALGCIHYKDSAKERSFLIADPDIYVFPLNPQNDFLILGSHGFWRTVPDALPLTRSYLKKDTTATGQDAAKMLISTASGRRALPENETVMVIPLETSDTVAPRA